MPQPNTVRNGVLRFALGGVAAVVAAPVGGLLAPAGPLGLLDWGAASIMLSTLVAGWPGLVGAIVGMGGFLTATSTGAANAVNAAMVTGLSAVPATLAMLGFHSWRGTSRALPDINSYLVLVGAALVGSVLAGLGLAWLVFRQAFLTGAGVWAAGMLTGILLLCPPIAIAAMPVVERRLPLRRSPAVRRPADGPPTAPGSQPHMGVLRGRRAGGWLAGIAGLTTIVLATAAVTILSTRVPGIGGWLNALLLVPVVWAARMWGLRGGLLGASATGLFFLAWHGWSHLSFEMHRAAVEIFPLLLVFCLVGSLLGAAIDREKALQRNLAASNLRLRQDLERAVLALGGALEARDSSTQDHVHRVAEFATRVGRRLGLEARDVELLRWASRLHDIGKIGIPDQVLLKPGPLAGDELELMRQHPAIGARILAEIDGLEEAGPLVLHHQERFDGCREGRYPGYPGGLAGDQIPLGARIIAVVDAFDAMTSDRPYRRRQPLGDAVAELRRERGRQFDPAVVDAFLAELEQRRWE